MAAHKHFDRLCAIVITLAELASLLLMAVPQPEAQAVTLGYEDRIFDTSRVHTIDIVIDDWDSFLATCQSEEYTVCSVVIDGESYKGVGIRGKGNTSLSTVSSMDSDRYSFKLEFDQYDSSLSYHGLDKLCLNNLIQDNTMMKDYLTYRMMDEFGAASPLCSYVYITVNGEDWGLYLAVEAIEDSFLQRNYGADSGDLYKPDSMSMGGGRGQGKDFNMEDFLNEQSDLTQTMPEGFDSSQMGQMMPGNQSGEQGTAPEGFDPSQMGGLMPGSESGEQPTAPEGFDPSQMGGMMPGSESGEQATAPEGFDPSQMGQAMQGGFDRGQMGGGMGMGSSDVKLQYIDEDPSSYSNIFDSAKTTVTDADQTRLIEALKTLSTGDSSAVDVDAVLRYFVVHNFVVNGDSYTGSMIHNYYLYEESGQLSMIPWDYNLAFGTFQGGSASSAVNDDINSPLSVTGSDRPMIDWIFASEEYTEQYHALFAEFLNTVDIQAIIDEAASLIAPYVEQDPTKFCTYEEFQSAVSALKEFCTLRTASVTAQLSGDDTMVDTGSLNLSDMGTMNQGMGGKGGDTQNGGFRDMTGMQMPTDTQTETPSADQSQTQMQRPGRGGMTASAQDFQRPADTGTAMQPTLDWLTPALTALILLFGLLFALKFRRR